jgi:hypothetical protein
MESRLTLRRINKELAVRGHKEELVRGHGYFYFVGGESFRWRTQSVLVFRLRQLTLECWMSERDRLAADCS